MSQTVPIFWNKLTPDERDALIAAKVMGWKRVSRPGGGGGYIAWQDSDGVIVRMIEDCIGDTCPNCHFFHPSTNIADAWLVVGKLKEKYIVELCVSVDGIVCSLLSRTSLKEVFCTEGKAAPESICIAALREAGYEVIVDA